jgi:biopolymer transport protein ExbD
MSNFRMKKRKKSAESFEINVTPMLDMFSVLIAFLLATAVFSSTGQVRVEVPFLSSKPPPPQEELEKNDEKTVTLTVDNATVKFELATTASSKPLETKQFSNDTKGLDDLQARLYSLRSENPKFDKVTVMTELEVKYENLMNVIEAMRELKPGRQPIPYPEGVKPPVGVDPGALIPKIVLGNVITGT